ncbi:MAG TPA: hypothetical protein VLD37_04340 [Candidatus Bilamarchaeum sp.]|nr:hypothetical protein [Candidatus Bilamarchaeum sp.]
MRERIVSLGVKADYVNARKLAAFRGLKLASNVLHDRFLSSDGWEGLKEAYPAWAGEILVYPEKNGSFTNGKDVVDSETGWVLPGSFVPSEAASLPGTGLLVTPAGLEENGNAMGSVIIHAGHVRVLRGLLQESGFSCAMEPASGIPLLGLPPSDERRSFWRIPGAGVRPIMRSCRKSWCLDGSKEIHADIDPLDVLGVLAAASDIPFVPENGC